MLGQVKNAFECQAVSDSFKPDLSAQTEMHLNKYLI